MISIVKPIADSKAPIVNIKIVDKIPLKSSREREESKKIKEIPISNNSRESNKII